MDNMKMEMQAVSPLIKAGLSYDVTFFYSASMYLCINFVHS